MPDKVQVTQDGIQPIMECMACLRLFCVDLVHTIHHADTIHFCLFCGSKRVGKCQRPANERVSESVEERLKRITEEDRKAVQEAAKKGASGV